MFLIQSFNFSIKSFLLQLHFFFVFIFLLLQFFRQIIILFFQCHIVRFNSLNIFHFWLTFFSIFSYEDFSSFKNQLFFFMIKTDNVLFYCVNLIIFSNLIIISTCFLKKLKTKLKAYLFYHLFIFIFLSFESIW